MTAPHLHITTAPPDGFLSVETSRLHEVLPGPTLIHLDGQRPEPLFVSVLLHGNEDVGLKAVQQVLRAHQGRELPRALSVFVGNVAAAREGVRMLPGGADYNRVWPGTDDDAHSAEQGLMARVVAEMRERRVFASVDLHNNTGLNPHYACVTELGPEFLQLATLFSRTVVYFRRPLGVQARAMARLCPSVTCECGRAGDVSGMDHAAQFVEACLNLREIPGHALAPGDIHLFHTVATVKVPEQVSIAFGEGDADLCFAAEVDRLNFSELPAGTPLARRCRDGTARLEVRDENGREVGASYLAYEGDAVRLARSVMPSMLTLREDVIRQDCLCYFMERYTLPAVDADT